MTDFDSENELPGELRGVSNRLRESQPSFTPLEFDQIKLRAMNQAESGKRRRWPLVSRWVTLGLATAILGGTAATGFASGGSFFGHGQNAAWSQYQPGHPCKPKGHFPWAYGYKGYNPCKPIHPIHLPPPPPPNKGKGNGGKGNGGQKDGGKNNGSQKDGGKNNGSQKDGGKNNGSQKDGGKNNGSQKDGGKDNGGTSHGH